MNDKQNMTSTNPYTPPMAEESLSLPPRVGSFTVGPERRFVQIYLSYWSGLEVYTVDGVVVLRTKNYQVRGVREFDVGQHKVIISLISGPRGKSFCALGNGLRKPPSMASRWRKTLPRKCG